MVRVTVLALLWGSGYLWTGLALRHGLSPLHITVLRAALGAAVLLVLARAARQRLPRGAGLWRRLVVAALLCNTLPFFLAAQGVRTVSTGLAGVLNATTPLWSLLLGLALGTERDRNPLRFAGLLLGFAGVLLIFSPWSAGDSTAGGGAAFGRGVLALLGAAVSYAVAFAYMGRVLTDTGTGPLAVSAAQLTAATGLAVLALPAGGTASSGTGWTDPVALVAVAVLGVFCTGFTFHLNYRLIALEGPTAAATVGYLLPVVSTALGALVLHEPLGARTVAGMAVVLTGVHLTRRRPASATAPTAAAVADSPGTTAAPTRPAPAADSPGAADAPTRPAPAAECPGVASASTRPALVADCPGLAGALTRPAPAADCPGLAGAPTRPALAADCPGTAAVPTHPAPPPPPPTPAPGRYRTR
ncbi:EamA family transporter [Streptomyces sp. NPDC020192]|uniref:DMT family transporter n=1 Tax=Streptomyces sp. NPDC020192 TaxID=3365066 RepID=UPI0037A2BDD2